MKLDAINRHKNMLLEFGKKDWIRSDLFIFQIAAAKGIMFLDLTGMIEPIKNGEITK